MSRIARKPITVPAGVELKQQEGQISIKGPKGSFEHKVHPAVVITCEDNLVHVTANEGHPNASAMLGTSRVLLENMVKGVHQGFEKKLTLIGVGYRAKAKGNVLELTLGFSHPVNFLIPEGLTAETPSNTEIVIKGVDKQKVGQIASEIRAIRPPEPYKGKGVRYADEQIILKETKKK